MGLYSTLWLGFKVPISDISREELRTKYPDDICCENLSTDNTIVAVLKHVDDGFRGLPFEWIREHEELIREEYAKHSDLHTYDMVLVRCTCCSGNGSTSYDVHPYNFEDLFFSDTEQ